MFFSLLLIIKMYQQKIIKFLNIQIVPNKLCCMTKIVEFLANKNAKCKKKLSKLRATTKDALKNCIFLKNKNTDYAFD